MQGYESIIHKLLMIRQKFLDVKFRPGAARTIAQILGDPRGLPGSAGDCLLCLGPVAFRRVCDHCERLLHPAVARCPRCAIATPGGETCGNCLREPPAFDAVVTALDYRFPADRLVGRFKFSADLAVGAYLGDALADAAMRAERPDLVVASPASPARLRERGFSPSLVLARRVSRRLDLAIDARAVRKLRDTPPQAGLGRAARRRNVADAFAVARRLDGLHVAVVDDVLTTGATLAAVAAALRAAGAARVSGWVAARTPEPPRDR